MSGYNYDSWVSNNCIEAYNQPELCTKSTLSARDLKHYGCAVTVAQAKAMMDHAWKHSEWHHTSCRFNKTKFYDYNRLASILKDNPESIPTPQKKAKTTIAQRVKCTYPVWGGTRKRPHIAYYKEVLGWLTGIKITTDEGRVKYTTGKYITYEIIATA